MSINFDNFPTFSEEHFHTWINELTPIEEHKGYLVKRDDLFNLGGVSGGKVRQCSKLVYDNLDHIKNDCNGGILTAAGIPSPQSCITSAVAKYFGLKCLITIPHYPDHIRDSYRVNASLSQKFGAKVYGVGNPNISCPELDAKKLVGETGYFQIKFGMNGFQVMNTVAQQVKNVPDDVEINASDKGVEVTFRRTVSFEQGSIEISEKAVKAMKKMLPIIGQMQNDIEISGHTDDTDVNNRFPSNWEMSVARASAIAGFLHANKIAPERMQVVGYGDSRPRFNADTAYKRALNRRVEILLLPEEQTR